jgi:signal transduction histidine kinase
MLGGWIADNYSWHCVGNDQRLQTCSRHHRACPIPVPKGFFTQEIVDVNEVIREMAVMLPNEANRHFTTIRVDLAGGLPKVMADRVQLQQALMNHMLNGIEQCGT